MNSVFLLLCVYQLTLPQDNNISAVKEYQTHKSLYQLSS